jgi:D-alanine-D-alanine ligase
MSGTSRKPRALILWNQVEEDEYIALAEQGPTPLAWNPEETAAEVGTVQDEIDAIVEACRKNGYVAREANIADSFELLTEAVKKFKPDVILNLVEFFNDESAQEAYIAGLFDLWRIPYTGSPPLTLLTCQRKFRTKVLLEAQGVPTPAYTIFYEPVAGPVSLPYPLIVKPAREDASGGIDVDSVVNNHEELVARVKLVLEDHAQPALVERFIDGREIHVAILGNSPPEVLPMLEFEFEAQDEDDPRPQILTYEAKWDPTSPDFYASDVQVPPRKLSRKTGNRMREAALAAYRITGCRDYARIDFRIDGEGEPYILEVNPNPDLAEGTGFSLCAESSGRSFEKMIGEILAMALARGKVASESEDADGNGNGQGGNEHRKPPPRSRAKGKPAKGKAAKGKAGKGKAKPRKAPAKAAKRKTGKGKTRKPVGKARGRKKR